MYGNIKQETKDYLVKNGIKQRFIAKKLNISDAMFSYFINDKKNLSEEKQQELLKIIRG